MGRATDREDSAETLVSSLKERIDAITDEAARAIHRPKVLQLEWADPLMCGGHWVVEMLERAGGIACFGSKEMGSMRLEWEEILESQPETILFMPCGFDLKRAIADLPLLINQDGWELLPAVRDDRVFVIDADAYTSRLGPRLVSGLEIMAEIIHPEIFTGLIPDGAVVRLSELTR